MHKCVNSGVLGACLETESALVALDGSLLVRPFTLGAERWGYAEVQSAQQGDLDIFALSLTLGHQHTLHKLTSIKFCQKNCLEK